MGTDVLQSAWLASLQLLNHQTSRSGDQELRVTHSGQDAIPSSAPTLWGATREVLLTGETAPVVLGPCQGWIRVWEAGLGGLACGQKRDLLRSGHGQRPPHPFVLSRWPGAHFGRLLGPSTPSRAGSSTWCPGWWPFPPVCSAGFSLIISSIRVSPGGGEGGIPPGCRCSKEEAIPLRTGHDVGPRSREPAPGALVPGFWPDSQCLPPACHLPSLFPMKGT